MTQIQFLIIHDDVPPVLLVNVMSFRQCEKSYHDSTDADPVCSCKRRNSLLYPEYSRHGAHKQIYYMKHPFY